MKAECDKKDAIHVRVDAEIAPLIPGFLHNRRKDVVALLRAVEQGDFERARVLGHSMKGSGGGYGFDAITEIGHGIETAAKTRDIDALRTCITTLSDYLDRVQVESVEIDT